MPYFDNYQMQGIIQNIMNAISISRVSTEEQKEAGNSLPAQEERIRSYCSRKSFPIIKEISYDESAYKTKRDEFDEIMKFIRTTSCKEKLVVCFDKVDRFSRNVFDKRVSELYEMAVADKIELHFVSDGQVINNQMSATEKFQFGISLGLAKYYSDAISDNVKRAFEKKRKDGTWTGKAPLGYLNITEIHSEKEVKNIIVDEARKDYIKKIYTMYASGHHSLETIQREMKEVGLRSTQQNVLSKSVIDEILKNKFYHGIAVPKSHEEYPHKYERIITKELFEKCREVRERRSKTPYKLNTKDYVFKAMLRCHNCGCAMSGDIKKGKYVYYTCGNSKGKCLKRNTISEKELIEQVIPSLDILENLDEETRTSIAGRLGQDLNYDAEYEDKRRQQIRVEVIKQKEKSGRILDLFIEGRISQEDNDTKRRMCSQEIERLSRELVELESNQKSLYKITLDKITELGRNAKNFFTSSKNPRKNVLLKYLTQNCTVQEKKLYFTIAFPLSEYIFNDVQPVLLPRQDSNL